MAKSTAELAPAGTAAGSGTKAKKSKKKLIMIVGPVLLVVVAAAYLLVFKKDGPPPPPKPGAVVAVDPITINLASGHFLKIGLGLQATAGAHEEPDGSKALDIAIDVFSNRTVAELSSNEARHKFKEKLREKVLHAYEHDVMDVYFTEFVMQ